VVKSFRFVGLSGRYELRKEGNKKPERSPIETRHWIGAAYAVSLILGDRLTWWVNEKAEMA